MSDRAPTIVWFRADLRISDNPALLEASLGDGAVIGLFILDDETPGEWCAGGAAKWWLHHSLVALEKSLAEIGGTLILRQGNAANVLAEVVREVNAGRVYWNRCYEPFTIKRDKGIKETLVEQGVEAKSFNGSLLFEPWTIETKAGGFYKVYTRYWFTCRDKGAPAPPLDAPTYITKFEGNIQSETLDDWGLLPTSPDWAAGFRARWTPAKPVPWNAWKRSWIRVLRITTTCGTSQPSRQHPIYRRICTSVISARVRSGKLQWTGLAGPRKPRSF